MVLSRFVGAEVRRKEDPRLITGSSMYVDDLNIPGTAYVAMVRSPHPHARIGAIDSSAALAMPGVIAVITGEELAQYCGPLSGAAGEGGSGEEADYEQREEEAEESPPVWPIAREKVRWVGEAVAAVIAESRYQAADAAEVVEVDYEVLPTITDPELAMEEGAAQLYETVKNNIGATWDRDFGDIEGGLRRCTCRGEGAHSVAAPLGGADGASRRAGDSRPIDQRDHRLDLDAGAPLEPQ